MSWIQVTGTGSRSHKQAGGQPVSWRGYGHFRPRLLCWWLVASRSTRMRLTAPLPAASTIAAAIAAAVVRCGQLRVRPPLYSCVA